MICWRLIESAGLVLNGENGSVVLCGTSLERDIASFLYTRDAEYHDEETSSALPASLE